MKKSAQNREQKQRVILDAARDIFFSDGYVGAGMDAIAQRAGVTKQTVYRYFASKEVLFQAVLRDRPKAPGAPFQDELEREDAREALVGFSVGFLELHLSEAHLAGIRLLIAEGPKAPEVARAFYAVGPGQTEPRLAAFLTGRFKVEDPEYAVRMLLGTLLSLRMHVLTGLRPVPSRDQIVRHAERSVDACLKGLAG